MGQVFGAKPTTVIREYKDVRTWMKDANRMAKKGYRQVSAISSNPRAGIWRILLLGPFAGIFRPQPVNIVTYERAV